jgi:hypothetical protein
VSVIVTVTVVVAGLLQSCDGLVTVGAVDVPGADGLAVVTAVTCSQPRGSPGAM